MSHANITQKVRMCYKIIIGFRDLFGCFCGVLDPIISEKSLFSIPIQPLLEGKSGSFA